jgi:hypothetical protein
MKNYGFSTVKILPNLHSNRIKMVRSYFPEAVCSHHANH